MSRVCLRPFRSSSASELAEIKPEVSPHPIYSDSSPTPATDHPTFNTRLMWPPGAVVVSVARRGAPLPLSPRQPRPGRQVEVVDGGAQGCVSCRVVRSAGTTGRSRPAPLSPPLGRGAATGCLPLHAQAPPPPPLFVALFPPSVAPPSAHSDSPPPLLPARNLGPFDSSLHFYFRCIAFQPTSSYS